MNEKNNDNFIMLPIVDFCFKELMKNPKARQGFVAAILGKDPKMIRKTTLLSTELRKENKDDKLGILDVLVELEDGSKMNMEMHILELKKLPPEDQNEDGVIRWMRFLDGKSRKEFEDMAKKDEYIEAAYDELKKLSLDEQKRLEYEQRQKAIRDHNSFMKSAERRGMEIGMKRGEEIGMKRGEEIGMKRGEKKGRQTALKEIIVKLANKNMSSEEIADFLEIELKEVDELMEE